jgi:aryl-alcohol dehydrogenase-like predicted oxidoreductase
MNYRLFGRLGWPVSEVGFGAWAIGGDMWGAQNDEDSISALHHAMDLGVNFIDTAQGYGKGHSETIIGRVLKERSEEIYVATKVPPKEFPWPPPDDADPRTVYPAEYIIAECEKSLRRLDRDHVDLYQFHTWAAAFNLYDEWYEAMERLRDAGKIRAIGVSVPDTKPDSVIGSLVNGRVDAVQVIYNLFEQYPETNLFPVCETSGAAVIGRVPFDEGALTGKFTTATRFAEGDVRNHYFREGNLAAVVERVEAVRQYKDRRHPAMPMAEYALRFCLSHPAMTSVIPGIRNRTQAAWNVAASDGVWLSSEEREELRQFTWRKDFWHEVIEAQPVPAV